MRWLEISIEAPGEYAEPLSALFARHADGGVAVEQAGGFNPDEGETGPPPGAPITVKGYLRHDDTLDSRKAQIDTGLRLISLLQQLPILNERTLEEDVWRRQRFEPVRVGRRLVVTSPDVDVAAKPGDLVIPIEPGLAFGTGHHPTTKMCLGLLERLVEQESRVLDVGCGSGILSIAALLLGAGSAVALDIDPDAVRVSRSNAACAGVDDLLTVAEGRLPHPAAPADSFDLVVANISSVVLIELAAELLACLDQNGSFVGSGYMEDRQVELDRALVSAGGTVVERVRSGEWVAVLARREQS